jgi:DNA gyrase/topoisomerase IV subunit B
MGATHDSRDIEVLEGLEPIRRRPGMYVGDVRDSRVLSVCVLESVRTLIHVGASRLIVTIEDDVTFEIVGEDALLSTETRFVEAVFASMLCGCQCIHTRRPMVAECNPALTNALSASFEVEVVGEGARTRVRWLQGRLDGSETVDATGAPLVARVRGVLDRQIFGEHAALVTHELDVLLDDLAVLAAGVRFHRRDARDGSTREHHAPGGLTDRVATRGVHDPLRLRNEQEDGGVLELALGWAGDGPAHVDAWSAGWRGATPAVLGEALLAALGEVLLPPRIPFERGPHAALSANLARGLVAALAVDTPATAKSPVGPPSAETLKPALGPYLLARPALLAELARRIGDTPDALSARLSTS